MTFVNMQIRNPVTAAIIVLKGIYFPICSHLRPVINMSFLCLKQPLAYRAHRSSSEALNEVEN